MQRMELLPRQYQDVVILNTEMMSFISYEEVTC